RLQKPEPVAREQRPPGRSGEPWRERKRRQSAEAAMLQRRSELTGVVAGGAFEPLGEPAMERPPRLLRKTSERSLSHQIVHRPVHTSALTCKAASSQLSCRPFDPLERPALQRRSLFELQRSTRDSE